MGETQSNRVFEALRAEILACQLAPASKINISTVCSRLGVSLGAAREALSRLIPEGLVRNEPQKGFSVAPVSRRELRDLTTARIAIETLCLRLAIAGGDVAWESRAMAALHRLNRIPPSLVETQGVLNPEWSAAHAQFHRALVEACDNTVLLRLRDTLHDESERYRHWCLPLSLSGSNPRDVAGEHSEILQSTVARAADAACDLMRDHLQRTADILARSPMIGDQE